MTQQVTGPDASLDVGANLRAVTAQITAVEKICDIFVT